MAKKPETKFKEKVLNDLKLLPHTWVYKTQDRTRSGIPDLILCLRGLFVAIELKVDSKVDEIQTYTLNKISGAYGITRIATPNNWGAILDDLKQTTKEF